MTHPHDDAGLGGAAGWLLEFNGNEILTDAGKITHEQAKLHAQTEYEKYRIIQDRLFESDFDRFVTLEHRLRHWIKETVQWK